MPPVDMVREQLGNATLIRLRGSFDLPQALELRGALAQLGDNVTLDFSQVDDLRVHALGIIARRRECTFSACDNTTPTCCRTSVSTSTTAAACCAVGRVPGRIEQAGGRAGRASVPPGSSAR